MWYPNGLKKSSLYKGVLSILKKVNYCGFMSIENRQSLASKEVLASVMDKIAEMYE